MCISVHYWSRPSGVRNWPSRSRGVEGTGHIYIVEPVGAFEDDPNLTNKRFPGNPTRSYRTREPLKIVGKVDDWQGHAPDVLRAMVDGIREKQRQGLAPIED